MPTPARHDATFDIIRETLAKLIPGAVPAFLDFTVTETLPETPRDRHTWAGNLDDLTERLHTALYGRRTNPAASPVEQADAAKHERDIVGEVGALMDGDAQLQAQPWYPVRGGDLVHVAIEVGPGTPGFGETYAVEPDPDGFGDLRLRPLHHTAPEDQAAGWFATDSTDDPLFEMWMEAGPQRLTVVRDGVVVHNGQTWSTR